MSCDDLEVEMAVTPKLNELDSALQELGMLSSCSNSRQEYLREIQNRPILSINTRYVSNVSIGFRVRPVTPRIRFKPYNFTKREERHRTRSENNDNSSESVSIVKTVLDDTMNITFEEISQLKKAKSLESIVLESGGEFKTPEVEIVSDCIEKLKVNE
ncbi:PREDICTED: uncharacterized protein LOC108565262 [Nicrophorus vespilloides]|uniref:Uncharacterized protein LOC108565262 n=1 Tax=Nicrophorus vespilloides TaxID=110193 RepID=A0ABM1N003_NICVS|nr:PREDICTED: uncharacterized protein LOC108565262 [Nicrophorus vespilloides]